MNRGRIVLILLGLLVAAWGVWIYPTLLDRVSVEATAIRVDQAIKRGDERIKVADLANFDWRHVCLVGSYEDYREIRVMPPEAEAPGWLKTEGKAGLAFVTDDAVYTVEIAVQPDARPTDVDGQPSCRGRNAVLVRGPENSGPGNAGRSLTLNEG